MQCTSVISYKECLTPERWNYPNITRPFSILYYVLGGRAFYRINGTEHRFENGHLYVLPANKVYSLWEDESDKFYALYIHAYTSPCLDEVIELDVGQDAFLHDTLEMMRRFSRERGAPYMQKLCEMLISYIGDTVFHASKSLAAEMRRYIDENYVKVYHQSNLSGQFNYSNSHLVKLFRGEYDLTPKQYAERFVLREIVLLLQQGRSVKEIAQRLDFSSPENLSRFFKGCYGCSPLQYLKKFPCFPR